MWNRVSKKYKLKINNQTILFPYKVTDIIKEKSLIIILLDTADKKVNVEFQVKVEKDINKSNILAFNQLGELVWQIDGDFIGKDSFVDIGYENNILTAYTWGGFGYTLEFDTGKILDERFYK